MRFVLVCILAFQTFSTVQAQFEPESAHVFLFFPQLADGGNFEQSWQTSVVLQNPSDYFNADCRVSTFTPSGQPLYLNLGMGVNSAFQVSIPPNGRRNLRSTIGPTLVTGWAVAECNVPVQGTILFRRIDKGVHAVEISAAGVSPTPSYRSVGNGNLGVAMSNMNSHFIDLEIIAYGFDGAVAGQRYLSLCPLCQTSSTLRELITGLPQNYEGSIAIKSAAPANSFAAWTLNEDRGLISSLPSGNASFPISQYDRICLIFQKLIHFADRDFPHLNLKSTQLIISPVADINASASSGTTVTINLAFAQLIADSPSELACLIGHEIAHIIQQRSGHRPILGFTPRLEHDADAYGMLLAMKAGYDPYGTAGFLGKSAMTMGSAPNIWQILSDDTTTHGSFVSRLRNIHDLLTTLCNIYPEICASYKRNFHPNFPPHMPLQKGNQSDNTQQTIQEKPYIGGLINQQKID